MMECNEASFAAHKPESDDDIVSSTPAWHCNALDISRQVARESTSR
jgi:hypothetical protein